MFYDSISTDENMQNPYGTFKTAKSKLLQA
jgi:hypothetical protein